MNNAQIPFSPIFSNIFDSVTSAVCIVDMDEKVLYWNNSAVNLYGIEKRDIVGQRVTDSFPNAILPKAMRERRNYEDVFNEPKKDCYIVISASPVFNDEGVMIGGISVERDITGYKKTEELLEKTKQSLKFLTREMHILNNDSYSFSNIIGKDIRFRNVLKLCEDVANSDMSVLLQGESGTGKELVARAIHSASSRAGDFVAINCSAIPLSLFESELFGYEAGAFTGALKGGRKGKIEVADSGTLFLDEIGDMPMEMQPKILRVLEAGTMTRLGANEEIKVSLRVIAASNKQLRMLCEEGSFRWDLFYRLASAVVELPPLRERRVDIPILINFYMENFCSQYGINIPYIPREIMNALINYNWNGNIRELKNVVERMVILVRRYKLDRVKPEYLPQSIMSTDNYVEVESINDDSLDLSRTLWETERGTLMKALERSGGNVAEASDLLNIPRTSLYYKLKKYNILIENNIKA